MPLSTGNRRCGHRPQKCALEIEYQPDFAKITALQRDGKKSRRLHAVFSDKGANEGTRTAA